MRRRIAATAALLLTGLALAQGVVPSGATFTAASNHAANGFATATAFNSVAVSVTNPGTPLRGTITVNATATSDEPMTSVRIQRSPAGAGTWTDICTDTVAAYSCSWATTGVADGLYDLRAIALDSLGYTQTSATVASRRVDNTAPTAGFTDPGTPMTGTETLAGTATDGGSGVANVVFEYRTSPSGSWTTICTDTTTTYGCSWNTAAIADGLYDLRTTSTDVAGNSTSSAVVSARRIDNNAPTVTVNEAGAVKRGTAATLDVTSSDGTGTGVNRILYEIRAQGTTPWNVACDDTAAPFTCTGDTTVTPDGLYELRATAWDGAGFSTVSAIVTIWIDNTPPSSATFTNPGTPLSGNRTLTGTGADAASGLAALRFEYRPNGSTGAWTTACTDSLTPFTTCSWNTTTATDGSYEMRSVAVDRAGNETASATVAARIVDNNGPTVSLTDPGSPLRATVTVNATATDVSGVQSVAIQRSPAGAGTWTTICTDATPAYSCAWNTTGVADGAYDLRAVATDTLTRVTNSTVIASRVVDNASPIAVDVQATNNAIARRIRQNDVVTFTYSQTMLRSSIVPGWTTGTTAVVVRVTDGGATDYMDFYNAADSARINLTGSATGLQLMANHVGAAGARFNATIAQTGATITVTLGTPISGTTATVAATGVSMVWTPSTSATNAGGLPVWGMAATETGTADADF